MLENDYFKPGKGQALNRIEVRQVKSGRVIDRTLKSGDRVEAADVLDIDVDYLYQDQQGWYFMSAAGDFEQYMVTPEVSRRSKKLAENANALRFGFIQWRAYTSDCS